MRPPSTCWSNCIASRCSGRCRSRRASTIALPPYDLDAFLIEAELLIDWYLPHRGTSVTSSARAEFDGAVARGAGARL